MRTRLLLATIVAALAATTVPVAAQEKASESYGDEDADQADYDDEDYGDEGFCDDGGEESEFETAYLSFDSGDYEDAREVLVNALRTGNYSSDMRPAYLVLLGQTQLRLDDSRHAAVNFTQAIVAAPEDAEMNGARLGLALALAERGDRRGATDNATRFVDVSCSSESSLAGQCYVANVVLATVGLDDETRQKGRTEATRLRAELAEWEQSVVSYYDELFDVADWTAMAVASPTENEDSADESI